MKRFKGKKFIIFISILLIAVLVIYFMIRMNIESAVKEVEKLTVKKSEITSDMILSGTIRSGDEVEINSELEDAIKAVYVEEGQVVKKGQALAALETDALRNKLESSSIDLDIAQKELQDSIEDTTIFRLEKDVQNKELELEIVKKDYENAIGLYENDVISKNGLDENEKKYLSSKNAYEIALKELEDEKRGSNRQIKQMQVRKRELDFKLAGEQLEDATIISPIDGTIVYSNCKVGIDARDQRPMFVVHNLQMLQVHANVNQFEIHKVKIGQSAAITGDAFPEKSLKGRVSYIAPSARTDSGQGEKDVLVKVDIIDPPEGIKTGFSADVDIVTDKKEEAIIVPYEALFQNPDGKYVVFKIEGDRIEEVAVELGIEGDLEVEIIGEGIGELDEVALNPDESFVDGMKVRIKGESK
ncbi:RND family efflux transporter, MFP subunit [Peptoclostridium litorale DSM 5388]|uniref:Putative HlyD family secretion protein n=1 Tax=Peptoclostridium litorale DSM 5388 TaxID=1121324 RepID=A0A069RFR2_PEPLI|nr:efflux RND transporter periplasmic adaptor subunit [Peptoclostridium litorale]KDR95035.1 putative HlyD family secretion protein [Peptoclostridium litorale DSM 5388]SIN76114.1 RND family efflux transporter, MFP subunit [Peptoclostridium litorale DSM 5388]